MSEPTVLTDEMADYLETLRESSITNMVGAAPYLERKFALNRRDAKTALLEWMTAHD